MSQDYEKETLRVTRYLGAGYSPMLQISLLRDPYHFISLTEYEFNLIRRFDAKASPSVLQIQLGWKLV